ncbi:MAG: glycogen/starch/alpha-glucan phosphorylase, partial [Firmicutes bacterium]|nr:glycogen/starch/alpha-glucan phosphorylase [Bacillota bacterium]
AEALEKWPMRYIEEVAPQLVPILYRLDEKARARCADAAVGIVDEGQTVHMAHLDIHYGFSVNGVAALHTDILKHSELTPFYALYPEKFSNKTNGISFRRWLTRCNPNLAAFITERIGPGWQRDAGKLSELLGFAEDDEALESMARIKRENKLRLKQYLADTQRLTLHEDAVYDIQVKRLHEYKRQQMNALYVIYQYKRIKEGCLPKRPLTMIFGGKAAPAYEMAKDIIHLILCLQRLVMEDPQVSPWLQVFMVENYNVTLAEKLIPACDISEQISLASKEASGTGNMKFMLNGAVTLGTLDGANVEIHDLVGDDNIFLFGATSDEVIDLYRTGAYNPGRIYRGDSRVEAVVDFIVGPELRAIGDTQSLLRVYKELVSRDGFMALLDAADYMEVKDWALLAYEDRRAWSRKMLVNTAKAGYFSSDRAIAEYNEGIWRLNEVTP